MNSETETPKTEPKDTRLIREITLRNILSFGPDTPPFELKPLNVLIGANGSGKSNLIDCIGLMKATAKEKKEVTEQVRGGFELLHKGSLGGSGSISIKLSLSDLWRLEHYIEFAVNNYNYGIELLEEKIRKTKDNEESSPFYIYEPLKPILYDEKGKKKLVSLKESQFLLGNPYNLSLLPVLAGLSGAYRDTKIYRSWQYVDLKALQPSDTRIDSYAENMSNLKPKIGYLLASSSTYKNQILNHLNNLYDGINDISVQPIGSQTQVWLNESDNSFSSNRLSDGTLRYLCLLAILCDPEPPPLICIEEPELGLHMDVLPSLARLFIEASKRTQLIVTTHSDIFVDALSESPESIVICEKQNGKTELRRIDMNDYDVWKEKYGLGQQWLTGRIGGKRW